MTRRAPKPLPPPTMFERADAAIAARALRAGLTDPSAMGERTVMHVDLARPRRGKCWETWAALPGFARVNGRYRHVLLPGWEYTQAELAAEMVTDLEALAERGVRPTEATAGAA